MSALIKRAYSRNAMESASSIWLKVIPFITSGRYITTWVVVFSPCWEKGVYLYQQGQ